MPRIFFPVTHIKDNRMSITNEKAKYLTSVLRCRKGDDLIVFDGKGTCLKTKILNTNKKEVTVEVLEKFPCDTESHINIILVQGLLKGEKMDMVIQKTTELGINEIMPVITERSQLRETRKAARWRKIAEEASRQSGRSMIPLIHEPMRFSDCISSLSRHPSPPLNGLLFYEEGGMKLSEAIQKITIQDKNIVHPASLPIHLLIGPEGGFTKEEVTLTKEKGLFIASLGKRILRAETAAISVVTLIQFLFGDMG